MLLNTMLDDRKDPFAPLNNEQEPLDAPPEYTPENPQASSSSTNHFVTEPPSDEIAHLFTRPLFAEDLYQSVDAERLHDTQDLVWKVTKDGDVRSWDPKLADPMALYEFIRYHAQIPPNYRLTCRGTHTETRNQTESRMENGQLKHDRSTREETVVDFDFNIDLTSLLQLPSVPTAAVNFFPMAPDAAAYRGTSHLSFAPVSNPSSTKPGRRVSKSLSKLWTQWGLHRWDRGLPSWMPMPADFQQAKHSRSKRRNQLALAEEGDGLLGVQEALNPSERDRADLMHWCQAYCASPAILKEFILRKQVWGWDTKAVKTAVTSAILSTGYRSADRIQVEFVLSGATVTAMPDNWLSRSLYNPWLFFLSCITLIFPLIWVWGRWSKRGYAYFDTARVAYPLKAYPELGDKTSPDGLTVKAGPDGTRHYLVGTREGAWVREWEATIREAVYSRRQGWLTSKVDPVTNDTAHTLDGYVREV